MAQARSPGGVEPPSTTSGAAQQEQATKRKRGRRGGRRRGKQAMLTRRIEAMANQRQDARANGEALIAEHLTSELNGPAHVLRPEGLFAALREERSGLIPAGYRPAGPTPDYYPRGGGGMAR